MHRDVSCPPLMQHPCQVFATREANWRKARDDAVLGYLLVYKIESNRTRPARASKRKHTNVVQRGLELCTQESTATQAMPSVEGWQGTGRDLA